MPAMVTAAATVGKGCGCFVSAQMGQSCVCLVGGGKLQQRGGQPGEKPIHDQVNGVTSEEEGSCRPGSNEIISATPKTTPKPHWAFLPFQIDPCNHVVVAELKSFVFFFPPPRGSAFLNLEKQLSVK